VSTLHGQISQNIKHKSHHEDVQHYAANLRNVQQRLRESQASLHEASHVRDTLHSQLLATKDELAATESAKRMLMSELDYAHVHVRDTTTTALAKAQAQTDKHAAELAEAEQRADARQKAAEAAPEADLDSEDDSDDDSDDFRDSKWRYNSRRAVSYDRDISSGADNADAGGAEFYNFQDQTEGLHLDVPTDDEGDAPYGHDLQVKGHSRAIHGGNTPAPAGAGAGASESIGGLASPLSPCGSEPTNWIKIPHQPHASALPAASSAAHQKKRGHGILEDKNAAALLAMKANGLAVDLAYPPSHTPTSNANNYGIGSSSKGGGKYRPDKPDKHPKPSQEGRL